MPISLSHEVKKNSQTLPGEDFIIFLSNTTHTITHTHTQSLVNTAALIACAQHTQHVTVLPPLFPLSLEVMPVEMAAITQ